jgi:DNA-binding transcriptional ArsR family regulator
LEQVDRAPARPPTTPNTCSSPRRKAIGSGKRLPGDWAADTVGWITLIAVDKPVKQLLVERASSALADVDTAGWTLRFDLLSDPNRLEILLCLHRAPGICVGDLAAALGRSENAVSQALRVLRQQGWVSSTRVGREVSYRLEDEIVHELLHRIGAQHG